MINDYICTNEYCVMYGEFELCKCCFCTRKKSAAYLEECRAKKRFDLSKKNIQV